jgi:hypothetical protein
VTAASRGQHSVIHFLVSFPSVDLFVRNVQKECAYDIAAEKGDLLACDLIERYERAHWSTVDRSGFPFLIVFSDLL